jgi:hypothetical protein
MFKKGSTMQHEQPNRNSLVAGGILVGLGVLLLIGQTFQFTFFNLFQNWNLPYPVYVIVPGILLMTVGLFGGRNLTGFTIVGSIVLVSGLLLAFQDATHSYQTWAYLWALVFPGSIGLALAAQSFVTQDTEQRKTGLRMMGIALVLAVVFWSFFEGAINLSDFGLNRVTNFVGPVLLIALGGWILFRRGFLTKEK